uniref:Isoform 2 of GRIP and coiled-coil domain-containing protein 2 n=1 Tax=Homo sapiens TaxID=9606 RepID=Q8IWJ2-3
MEDLVQDGVASPATPGTGKSKNWRKKLKNSDQNLLLKELVILLRH